MCIRDSPKLQSLCGISPGSTTVNLSNSNMGPADCLILTHELQAGRATAAVKNINLSGCPLAGAKKIRGNWNEIDSDMTGFIALCGVLGKLHEINMSDCGLGAASAGEFAKAVSDADAALALLNISFNKIGSEGGVALVEALKTSNIKFLGIGKQYTSANGGLITRSRVQTGVNLFLAGRGGEIVDFGSNPDNIKLKWQDDGSTSDWIDIKTMDLSLIHI